MESKQPQCLPEGSGARSRDFHKIFARLETSPYHGHLLGPLVTFGPLGNGSQSSFVLSSFTKKVCIVNSISKVNIFLTASCTEISMKVVEKELKKNL